MAIAHGFGGKLYVNGQEMPFGDVVSIGPPVQGWQELDYIITQLAQSIRDSGWTLADEIGHHKCENRGGYDWLWG